MKRLLFYVAFLTSSIFSSSQALTPVENSSKVHFVIDNFGIATGGDFTGITGSIKFDMANPVNADFDVSVDAATVNTNIGSRDSHLKRSEYLDVTKYPRISFKSTKITKTNKDGFLYMFGNLTIKNVTKEVRFPFAVTAKDGGYLFEGTFKINRRDYGVGGSSISLSDELTITLSVLAKAN